MSIPPKIYLWKHPSSYYLGYVDERGKKRWISLKTTYKNEALKKLTGFREV